MLISRQNLNPGFLELQNKEIHQSSTILTYISFQKSNPLEIHFLFLQPLLLEFQSFHLRLAPLYLKIIIALYHIVYPLFQFLELFSVLFLMLLKLGLNLSQFIRQKLDLLVFVFNQSLQKGVFLCENINLYSKLFYLAILLFYHVSQIRYQFLFFRN